MKLFLELALACHSVAFLLVVGGACSGATVNSSGDGRLMFFAGDDDEISTMANGKGPARQAVGHGAICVQVIKPSGE